MHFWKSNRRFSWLWGTLIGITFIGIGAMQNQFDLIWRKAVMICMECIGIG